MSKEFFGTFGLFTGLIISGLVALTVEQASAVAAGCLIVGIPSLIAMVGYAIGRKDA